MRRMTSRSSPSPPSDRPATSAPSVSQCSATSAKSRAGRDAVPAKMTSSMPPPRIDLGEDSPITQRIASSRLDLPQPLGPTTPVNPGSMRNSVGSTKDLKPVRRRRFICTEWHRAGQRIADVATLVSHIPPSSRHAARAQESQGADIDPPHRFAAGRMAYLQRAPIVRRRSRSGPQVLMPSTTWPLRTKVGVPVI